MDYWHDIIENYDSPNIKGTKSKGHGEFSQKSTVILLMYLAFGTDYPTGIADYFRELSDRRQLEKDCPSILTNSNKVSAILKKMNEDSLVIISKKRSAGAGTRIYYVLNPQILQSPIKDATSNSTINTNHVSSIFMIPLDTIEGFLGWLALRQAGKTDKKLEEQLRQERHEQADEIFEGIIQKENVDHYQFMLLIEDKAKIWDLQRNACNQQPVLGKLISEYMVELNSFKDDEYN